MVDNPAVQGVVLAGGDSARFDGGEKALATLDDRPLVAHVAAALRGATSGPLLLAVRTDEQGERLTAALQDGLEEPPGVDHVTDAATHAGPVAGLLAVAGVSEQEWVFACACDMPLVTTASIESVIAAAGTAAEAIVPVVDGHPQPTHALYRTAALDRIRDHVPESGGLRALLGTLDSVREVSPATVGASLDTAITNVNTRAQLDALRGEREPR